MTYAIHPDDETYDAPGRRQGRKPKLDIPKISLFSWLGLESVIWGVIIGHLVKWAGNFTYFAAWQVRYGVGYGPTDFTVWYGKDLWDRLPVHISNLAGYHWADQSSPAWWVTWRHDIRDVGIALFATLAVTLLFAKPKHAADDQVPVKVYVRALPLALGAALVPIAAVGVLAWKIPWLMQHGWAIPARFGWVASEVNGWVAAGTWITVVMGILGGLAAKPFIRRVADDIQWFFAERSAGKVLSGRGLDKLRGSRVYGTPAHRRRVHWLLERRPDLPERSPWLVRALLVGGFFVAAFAAAGAWLTLVGPAAVH